MRLINGLSLALILVAGLLTGQVAAAKGGEDWPHFCQMQQESAGGVDSFKIYIDQRSPTGYGLELLSGGDSVGYIVGEVSESADHTYYQVYGRQQVGVFRMKDRQILAFVQKDSAKTSSGDVQITWHNADGEFYMKPMQCGAK